MSNRKFTFRLMRWGLSLMTAFLFNQAAIAQYSVSACTNAYENITTSGVLVPGSTGDDVGIGITLPFTFNFYGVNQTTATVTTNGFMTFPGTTIAGAPFTNQPLAAGNNGIFPYWDDLNGAPGIFTQTFGTAPNRRFVIQWNKPFFGGNDPIDFQVVLFETTNAIQIRYADLNGVNGSGATIGIAGPSGTGFTQIGFNQAVVSAGQCLEFLLPPPCVLTCPANITVNNSPGTCGAVVNYTIDAGSCGGFTLNPNLPSGSTFPRGTTVLTATSGFASCSFSVTVNDTEAPTVNCPANMIVNLDPGLCSAFVNYNVTASDNCPFIEQGPALQYPTSFVAHGGGQAYTLSGNTLPGGVFFNLTNNSSDPVIVTGFGIRFGNPAFGVVNAPQTMQIYSAPTYVGNETNPGAWTNVGPAVVNPIPPHINTGTGPLGQANLTSNVTIAPGQTRGFHIFGQTACPVFNWNFGGAVPPIVNGPLTATAGSVTFGLLSNPFQIGPIAMPNIQVNTQIGGEAEIIQTSGLESGSEFEIGTTENCFEVTDVAGLTGECCFTVTVLEFPNPTNTLACNDNVQISLDEDGCVEVGADMVLEGGPYGCYDDYIVEILNQFGFPTGNQVCCNNVGETKTVRVTDPNTGNKCWGTITVEDKLPPVIECRDITVSCTEEIPELPAPASEGLFLEVREGLSDPIGTPGVTTQEYEFDLSYLPVGAPVLDVDMRIKLTGHTWLPDLNMEVIAPDGTSADVFTLTGCFGQEWPIDVWFDDEGAGGLTQCVQLNVGGANIQPVVAPGASGTVLFNLDGLNASGIWTVRITDNTAGDDGVIEIVGLKVEVPDFVQVDPTDNCAVVDLSFTETSSNGNCNGPSATIIRVWTATDASGNSASCTQTITRKRPTLGDVELPPHYDGIDEDVLDCSGNGWDTNGNGYPDVSETGGPTITGIPFVNGDICNLTTTYEDVVIDICGDSYKVLRKWLIIDWCTAEQATYDQLIKVLDQTGPTAVCPQGPVTINVYQSSFSQGGPHTICTGFVVIPPVQVTGDDCSGVDASGYVTQLWTLGAGTLLQTIPGNGGTFANVELIADNPPTNNAQYTVRHVFRDNCGNESDCIYNITVVDKVPPVPVCDEITELALTNNGGSGEGCSTLPAHNLDDGSYDNCGDVYFYAAKMNPFLTPPYFYQYYPTLEFCCDEIGDNMVVVLVLDFDPTTVPGATLPDGSVFLFPGNPIFEGSFNTCMVTVGVVDKIPPVTLFCPQGQTITCDTYLANYAAAVEQGDFSVLNGFGAPQFYDNCDYNLTTNVNVNLNTCTEGTITRSWTASDANGQATCTQVITVTHVSDWVVEFPADFTGECQNGQLPDTGEPEIFFDECELIGVAHSDQLFTIVPDACYKIVRTWSVINWCVYDDFGYDAYSEAGKAECNLNVDWDGDGDRDCRTFRDGWNSTGSPGTPDGYITYKQTIKVIDNEAPAFTIPAIDGCITDTDCDTDITLPYPDINDECSLAFDVDITGDFGSFNNITADVTIADVVVGEYEVTYAVTDNCGNTSYQTITVVVEDCKKPTPLCDNGLVVEIMQTQMVMVEAEAFDEGSWDNCGPIVAFSYSSDVNNTTAVFTCDDLGQNPVQIWVTDIYGNQDFCETFLVVQDNMNFCNSAGGPTIAGAIATEGENGVEGVDVQVNGGLFAQFTDINGDFTFNGLPAGGDYSVTPMLDENPGNGVTTYDLVLISRHILGIQNLNTPYKIIAADANKSNSVTTLDMVVIRKVILQIEPGFANNTSWRFVNKDFAFANPTNPFAAQFPEVINYNNLSADDLNADFVAIKVGDVNGSAATNLAGNAEERTFNGALNINVEEQQMKAGKTYTVAFTAAAAELLGYQFTLNVSEAVEVVDLIGGVAGEENFGLLLEEGVITTSWNVSEARALAQGEVLFTLVISANADVAVSEAFAVSSSYTVAEAYNSNSELLNVNLTISGQAANEFALYQNVPNPFKGVTVVGFTLPEAASATLKVMDVSGKVLQVVTGDYAKGYNEVRLSNIAATGVLYYQLDTPTHSATKKMIIIE